MLDERGRATKGLTWTRGSNQRVRIKVKGLGALGGSSRLGSFTWSERNANSWNYDANIAKSNI
jgi:hypothetical protein